MNDPNLTKHMNCMAHYMAVRHLSHEAAAKALGRSVESIRHYRYSHPSVRPDVAVKPEPVEIARPGIIQVFIPMAEPSRSISNGGVQVMAVSLPKPPPGVTFDRQGVGL